MGYHACQGDCFSNGDGPSVPGDPCALTEAYGVFVSPLGSDTTGDGSRAHPYATLGHALDMAATGTKRVYACGSAGNYTENLTLGTSRDGLAAYGGLDCTTTPGTWTYSASKLATVAPASGYALQVSALTKGATFEDFAFQAVSAPTSAPASGPGASSIAVLVSGAAGVTFTRGKIVAGSGQPGAQGVLSPFSFPSAAQLHGNPGTTASGGAALAALRPDGSTTTGGNGGDPPMGNGGPGQPNLGQGAGGTFAACDAMTGGQGQLGGSGQPGGNGPGATTAGALSGMVWQPASGSAGKPGAPGQGGGGGGASSTGGVGGGGGGGAGGCGGAGGGAGGGGGASIGVLAINATGLAFNSVILITANGGPGGAGAGGQSGQSPGGTKGVVTGAGGCNGGNGGSGGIGGPGGGGAGGSSVGIFYSGAMPTVDATTQTGFQQGSMGAKGAGGAPGTNDGVPGSSGLLVAAP